MTPSASEQADSAADEKLGFIGLGNMGKPMAANLAASGQALCVYDAAGAKDRAPANADAADSVAAVAVAASTVFLSLPDGDVVRTVTREIAAASPRATHTVVDLSTIGTAAALEVAEILSDAGIAYLDAPVSGGVRGAIAASLALMASGEKAAYDRLEPILRTMTANPFYVGEHPGQGQAMKLANNFLSATAMTATSEAIHFGRRHGLDFATMLDVLNASSGRNTATSDKFPRAILTGTFDQGFSAALMAKDVRLYREGAYATTSPAAVATVVADLCEGLAASMPDADFTRIYEFIKGQAQR